jgi:hypothetical protein
VEEEGVREGRDTERRDNLAARRLAFVRVQPAGDGGKKIFSPSSMDRTME